MNRRGFLSFLGGALAVPFIPSTKTYSFLGGILRPRWSRIERPVWPMDITIRGNASLTSRSSRGDFSLKVKSETGDGVCTIAGFSPPDPSAVEVLVSDRGDYLIQPRS